MAPPATKRRKLSHSDDDKSDPSGDTPISFNIHGSNSSVDSAKDERTDNSDASMHDIASSGDGLSDSEDNSGPAVGENSALTTKRENKEAASKLEREQKSQKAQNTRPHDGVYTAEVYKSNVFKLQVDELLEQVKLKYGKKEAPVENAMRTLKSIIEQLPSRAPASVRFSINPT